MALVLAATLGFGWWSLSPYDYDQLGAYVAAGAGFVANILLWKESGYFDTDSALKPLLHLWSLGVEEQYYLLWPLMLFLMRARLRRILWLIICVGVASFALNIALIHRFPQAVFYLPVTRFWELMLGSGLAYLRLDDSARAAIPPRWSQIMAIGGVAVLALSFAFIRDGQDFPGWRALLPTLAAVLLIQSGPRAWINRRILGNRVMVYIGLISYPLYLWHWPILSLSRIINGEMPPVGVRIAGLVASVVLACATFELIEKPIRRAARGAAALRTVGIAAACVGGLAVYGLLVFGSYAQARSDSVPHLAELSEAYSDWDSPQSYDRRGYGPGGALLRRQSHATVSASDRSPDAG